MAAVAKSGNPSLASVMPPANNRITGLFAGQNINVGDACYIASTGLVMQSIGTAANAAAEVDGFSLVNALSAQNDAVTLVFDVVLNYGSGLTPGAKLYVSGTVAGGLDTAVSTGGTKEVARCIDTTRIYVQRSRY